jgi:hypothetical protein
MHTARLKITITSLLSLTMPGTVSLVTDAAAEPPTTNDKIITFFSESPLATDARISTASLPMEARAQLSGSLTAQAPPEDLAGRATRTPRGYKLRKGRRYSDRVYRSAHVYAVEASCTFQGCRPVQQILLQLKERPYKGRPPGGNSDFWILTMYARPYTGSHHFKLRYTYECGVNIRGAVDQTCSTWVSYDGADGPSGPANAHNGFEIKRNFGWRPWVTKFPMVNFLVTFNDGSHAIGDDGHDGEKFRGWDVCVEPRSAKLCRRTGTGD